MQRPTIVPIGGFLGAGKTSLIIAAAKLLQKADVRVAAILNDQGKDLVDTSVVEASNIQSGQVVGGCFCCRLSELVLAARQLCKHQPQVIFAEAVGSCTDISATVMQPLKLHHAEQFRVAPYTVLVDPERAGSRLEPDLQFLFRKQIEEADILCFSKTDRFTDFPLISNQPTRFLSSQSGEGVSTWLDDVLGGRLSPGNHILDIDYTHYARAEASLAWLNCSAVIRLEHAASPLEIVGRLMDGLCEALMTRGLTIAHLKMIDNCSSGWVTASVVSNQSEPSAKGNLDSSPATVHELLLNARAVGSPEDLTSAVEQQMAKLSGSVNIQSLSCFRPSAPQPEERITYVVDLER